MLDLYEEYLKADGVSDLQIIRLNLEDPEYHELKTCILLNKFIKERLQTGCMNYVFIDEAQIIPEFQKAIDFIHKNCDLYIAGSNASILSGGLSTLLSGRYVEIKMLPLSFKEYIAALGARLI